MVTYGLNDHTMLRVWVSLFWSLNIHNVLGTTYKIIGVLQVMFDLFAIQLLSHVIRLQLSAKNLFPYCFQQ